MMRSVPGRGTARFDLAAPEGGRQTVYLKRYEREYLTPKLRWLRRAGWPAAQDEALHEWGALWRVREAGFRTARPLAAGQQRIGGLVERSFLMTAEIRGGIAAHEYMRGLPAARRRAVGVEIAALTRRFLREGFAHRDYYLSHVFVVDPPSPGGARELFLIDLQRVFRPRFFRRRWLVKDLAALAYTAQLAGATHADLMAFYRECFEAEKLGPGDKRTIRGILRRVRALHARSPKYDVIWDKPGVRPPNV